MLIEINRYSWGLLENSNDYGIYGEPRKVIVNTYQIIYVNLIDESEKYAQVSLINQTLYTDIDGYNKLKAAGQPTYVYPKSSVDIKF